MDVCVGVWVCGWVCVRARMLCFEGSGGRK